MAICFRVSRTSVCRFAHRLWVIKMPGALELTGSDHAKPISIGSDVTVLLPTLASSGGS